MSEELTRAQLLEEIAGYGNRFDAEVAMGMRRLIAPLHGVQRRPLSHVSRDLVYGPHVRHRLDVFAGEPTGEARPALVFVHGGGFTAGDKRAPADSAFYDNVGAWANRHGLIGITINYRLAPDFKWPSGAEDLAAAITWIQAHAGEFGIDAGRIVVMGQSAGAAHVASYVASPSLMAAVRLRAAVLLSGLYEVSSAATNPPKLAYFGADAARYAEQSSIPGLCASKVPLMVAVNEYDPPDFQRQTVALAEALLRVNAHLPRVVQFTGDNHVSNIFRLNLADDPLGEELAPFIARHAS